VNSPQLSDLITACAAALVAVFTIPAAVKSASELGSTRRLKQRLDSHLDSAQRLSDQGLDGVAALQAARRVSAQLSAYDLVPSYSRTVVTYLLCFVILAVLVSTALCGRL